MSYVFILPAIINSLQVNMLCVHFSLAQCSPSFSGTSLCSLLKRPPGGIGRVLVAVCVFRAAERKSFLLQIHHVGHVSEPGSVFILCVVFIPNTTDLKTVLERGRRGGVDYKSVRPYVPFLKSSHTSTLTTPLPSSLLLTRLFRALGVWLFPLIWPLWPLCSLPLSLGPLSAVWALATGLWPVVCLAAVTARALVGGWGSWLGLAPFGNLLVLWNTGGDVGDPRFKIILVRKIHDTKRVRWSKDKTNRSDKDLR